MSIIIIYVLNLSPSINGLRVEADEILTLDLQSPCNSQKVVRTFKGPPRRSTREDRIYEDSDTLDGDKVGNLCYYFFGSVEWSMYSIDECGSQNTPILELIVFQIPTLVLDVTEGGERGRVRQGRGRVGHPRTKALKTSFISLV